MNIRRFVATDMRAALAAIRGELGPDAVMLSNRKLPEGVEVIAAIDYDDSLLGGAGQKPGEPLFGALPRQGTARGGSGDHRERG